MAITSLNIEHLGDTSWRVYWTADTDGPFYVYRDGILLDTTEATEVVIACEADDPGIIDVLDMADAPGSIYPARITLGWYHAAEAVRYRIEEYITSAWLTRAKVEDDGRWFFTWTSRVLEDGQTHQFRIVPESTLDGTPKTLTALMVRHPDAPDPSYSYNAGTRVLTVTVS